MSRADVCRVVREGERFLVTCHRRPDADALGSALGWAAILRHLGKRARVYSIDPAPRTMRYLEAVREVAYELPPDETYDACFVMDAAAGALVPPMPPTLKGPVVMFDHHAAHDDFGDVILRETDAVATGIVVLRMMRELGVETVPPAAAAPLYAAIVADTGGFRYAGTDADTMRVAAELIEAGAEPWPTAKNLFEEWPKERMKLLGLVLEKMEVHADGRLALLRVTREMMRAAGADDEMVEGMVNYGRLLEGVEVSLLVWELVADDGAPETKVSLRSAGPVDVSTVALALGGGGHRSAAGANVREGLEATAARAVAILGPILAATP